METRPIDAYALRCGIMNKYESRSDITGRQMLANVIEEISKFPTLQVIQNAKLSVGELQELPDGRWVWIEFSDSEATWPSAYYQKVQDFSRGRAFCCGYPTQSFAFDYSKYGLTWTAYRYEPQGGIG